MASVASNWQNGFGTQTRFDSPMRWPSQQSCRDLSVFWPGGLNPLFPITQGSANSTLKIRLRGFEGSPHHT